MHCCYKLASPYGTNELDDLCSRSCLGNDDPKQKQKNGQIYANKKTIFPCRTEGDEK